MQAIILAAGMGKRLKDLTREATKCMVPVNGVPLIKRVLGQLDSLGLERIILVVGYKADALKDYISSSIGISTPIEYVENEVYDKTNNIYSLYLAREYLLKDDTLLLESDLIFDDGVLRQMVSDPYPSLALVDKYESWMDGTVVTIDEDCNITRFVDKRHFKFNKTKEYYKTVNVYKFSREFSSTHYVPFLEAYSSALGKNEYYEQVLKVIALLDDPQIKALVLDKKYRWYEIDDIQDLDIAESIFIDDPKEKNRRIQSRYGGFWRYPGMLDFCYLVNPYYPPKKMVDELKANFQVLMESYPSGQRVNNLLAAKNFSVRQDQIMVGNGAAELINMIMSGQDGKIGVILPSFEEYINRLDKDKTVVFSPQTEGFRYSSQDLISFYGNNDIGVLVLVNPDNPSGNFIDREGMDELLSWSRANGITLIVDESFSDFAENNLSYTLIDSTVLDEYKNLVVMKSISKSYGVPGFRLGVMATSNDKIMAMVRKRISIWNINSFGEFFMQIEEKYHKDYLAAMDRFRKERKRFFDALSNIKGVHPFPSQANYIMCRIDGFDCSALTERLLGEYGIIIKDLSHKRGFEGRPYIRLAVRNTEDNDKLIAALIDILS